MTKYIYIFAKLNSNQVQSLFTIYEMTTVKILISILFIFVDLRPFNLKNCNKSNSPFFFRHPVDITQRSKF